MASSVDRTSTAFLHRRSLAAVLFVVGPFWLCFRGDAGDAGVPPTGDAGEHIYRQRCASCHGESGEGVKDEYSRPLVGDKSLRRLTRYIEKSMPDEKPETCVGEDAERVARYIYDAFYSPIAQARHRTPRVELSRLTVRQYRNAVSDLVGSFRAPSLPGKERGLRGEYFNSRQPGRSRVLARVDPQVRFDFGRSRPAPGKLDPRGFSVRWVGSVIAAETGRYEFLVRTDHAARFWLNDAGKRLIDAWVKSGDDTEYTASIFLIGGRAYPLKLEFTSRKQGVEDKKKRKKPVEAFIELCWKLPKRVSEVIPSRHLTPQRVSERFVVETPFPPDDRSSGYERGTSTSKAWDEATTRAAIETAGYVAGHLEELAGIGKSDVDRETKVRKFCRRLVERAFRRPLSDEQHELYVQRQFAEAPDPETAVKRVVLLALKSPRFLYLDLASAEPDAYTVASRLSFALWDSPPDQRLLDAARGGQLATLEQVTRQAERMIHDRRTRSKVRQFLHHWLDIEHMPDLAKDAGRFPGFGKALASDLRTSLDLFLDDVIWGEDADFRRLLLSDELHLNGRLAGYYGFDLPADAAFQRIRAEQPQRAGVLSHPYVMARFAYTDATSPIHRGVFLFRSVLGRALRPPPEAFAPLAPDLHPDLTTRERVALQTQPESCQACHAMINPLGFTLERFDAVGRYREEEKGKPIDTSGSYALPSGGTETFHGARDLAEFLAGSEQAHGAFVVQLFHHLVKQPILAYGPATADDLRKAFAADEFNVRKLMTRIATTYALAGLRAAADGSPRGRPVRRDVGNVAPLEPRYKRF